MKHFPLEPNHAPPASRNSPRRCPRIDLRRGAMRRPGSGRASADTQRLQPGVERRVGQLAPIPLPVRAPTAGRLLRRRAQRSRSPDRLPAQLSADALAADLAEPEKRIGGPGDGSAEKTPERESFARFVWAYSPTTVRLWGLRSRVAQWPTHRLEDLGKHGKLILGVTRGDSYGTNIDAWLKQPPPTVSVDIGPTLDINVQKLRAKRLDLLLANSATMRAALQAQATEPEVVPLAPVWNTGGAYFIFSKSSVPRPVVEAFQQALTGMRRDGSIQALYQQHFEAPYPEE
ncbi:transporter substrate-binding domain-containing protein [Chromobacterium haemolyticum]|nr:transporter substrate-binding domain-containing protein [Chromobacterium haemolyticum]